jgi:hypothetical protein
LSATLNMTSTLTKITTWTDPLGTTLMSSGTFTPPAGKLALSITVAAFSAASSVAEIVIALRKNGSVVAYGASRSPAVSGFAIATQVAVSYADHPNGTDTYDLQISNSPNNGTVLGTNASWMAVMG